MAYYHTPRNTKQKYAVTLPIVGRVEFKLQQIIHGQFVNGRKRSIKILVNPLNPSDCVYGYHDFDGKFIKVKSRKVGLAA